MPQERKRCNKKNEEPHVSFKTLIISALHQYHYWEQGLETVGIRETGRSGYSIWVKKHCGLLKTSSEFNHLKNNRFRRV